jgi:hypothetical protein
LKQINNVNTCPITTVFELKNDDQVSSTLVFYAFGAAASSSSNFSFSPSSTGGYQAERSAVQTILVTKTTFN